jgi:hypothetical protein
MWYKTAVVEPFFACRLPRPSLTQALFHSLRKFVVSNTGPTVRNFFLSIPASSAEIGKASGFLFFTAPAGK